MPRACSIRAVVSPPTPPPTIIAFMHPTLHATPRAILAHPGTGNQPPGSHTVSSLYGNAVRAVNAGAHIPEKWVPVFRERICANEESRAHRDVLWGREHRMTQPL